MDNTLYQIWKKQLYKQQKVNYKIDEIQYTQQVNDYVIHIYVFTSIIIMTIIIIYITEINKLRTYEETRPEDD